MLVRVVDGTLQPKDRILLMATQAIHLCEQVGVFTPKSQPRDAAVGGRGGLRHRRHQGTAGRARSATPSRSPTGRAAQPLPGFKEIKPQVFAGLYPVESNQYDGAARRAGQAAS